jgi:hypothetical protein
MFEELILDRVTYVLQQDVLLTGSNNYFISGLSNAPKNEAEAFNIDNRDRLK